MRFIAPARFVGRGRPDRRPARRTASARLGVEHLEARETPAYLTPVSVNGLIAASVEGPASIPFVSYHLTPPESVRWTDASTRGTASVAGHVVADHSTVAGVGASMHLDRVDGRLEGGTKKWQIGGDVRLAADSTDARPRFFQSNSTFVLSASFSLKGEFKIVGSPAEPEGSEVEIRVDLSPFAQRPTYQIGPLSGSGSYPRGTLRFRANVGDTVPFLISSSLSRTSSAGSLFFEMNSALAASIGVSPVMRWDPVAGGVIASNQVYGPPGTADVEFMWATGKKPSAALSSFTVRPGQTDFRVPAETLRPPEGAKYLLMRTGPGDTEDSVAALAYDPQITALTAKYDGTGPNDDVFGRFFAGVPGIDQTITVTLSESLAALLPEVRVDFGFVGRAIRKENDSRSATKQPGGDGLTYTTDRPVDPARLYLVEYETAPGTVTVNTDVTAVAFVGGVSQGGGKFARHDVESLPRWSRDLTDASVTWAAVGGSIEYELTGRLRDIETPSLFHIPAGIWLGGGTDLEAHLTARVGVKVVAGLDPTAAPAVSGTLDLSATFLGHDLLPPPDDHRETGDGSNFAVALDLDPRTLLLNGGTVSYDPPAVTTPAVPLFPDRTFAIGGVSFRSALTFTPSLDLGLNLVLNSVANLTTGSSLDAGLTGPIGGELLQLALPNTTAAVTLLRARRAVALLVRQGVIPPPAEPVSLSQLTFEVTPTAGSGLSFQTRVRLDGVRPTIQSETGRLTFGAEGAVYYAPTGSRLFALPPSITDDFKLDKTWNL